MGKKKDGASRSAVNAEAFRETKKQKPRVVSLDDCGRRNDGVIHEKSSRPFPGYIVRQELHLMKLKKVKAEL